MFTVTQQQLNTVLRDYGIPEPCSAWTELQRYRYEQADPASREVRLIGKAVTEQGRALVLRFRNEQDVTQELVEAQSRFAALLAANGIETPALCASGGQYARWYSLGGYRVIVTVEAFAPGQLQLVDEKTAEETGRLLARMHRIAESSGAHVANAVLFDPLDRNDLFRFEAFTAHRDFLEPLEPELYRAVVRQHDRLLEKLEGFRNGPRYAVQGDLSDCNLYRTPEGRLGVFDFNRCGDNLLYFDAVMQAVFVARLMDYPPELGDEPEARILPAFLRGYHRERPFTAQEAEAYPALYALISAFWLSDLLWDAGSLSDAVLQADAGAARGWMHTVYARAAQLCPMPL